MPNYFVADSYKNYTPISEPYEENGKMYINLKMTCPRCGGTGHYSYNEIDGTICYGCGGRKVITKKVRAYTESQYNSMVRAAEKRKAAKAEAREKAIADAIENADKYRQEIAQKLGFNEAETAYIICGGNTYYIKDELKEKGARFDSCLKWYVANEIELPEGFFLCPIAFSEVYNYNVETKRAYFKDGAVSIVEEKIQNFLSDKSVSTYYPAEVKDKIEAIPAILSNISGYSGYYGYTYVYEFTSDNYVFCWKTAKDLGIAVGTNVALSGTIKEFNVYNGKKITYVTRCKVEKAEG